MKEQMAKQLMLLILQLMLLTMLTVLRQRKQ